MFQELAEGVFRRRYESLDLNIGVVVSEVGVLVVDTRASHVEADELRAELRQLTPEPIRWVVDTHWHWDHTYGNARFPEAEIWGHVLCREGLLQHGDAMREDAARWLPAQRDEFEEVVITPPTHLFSTTATIDMGSRQVVLSYHGLGHTDADIAISVDGREVLFLGDLVEEGSPPLFGDAYPMSWPRTLRSALGEASPLVVPGHGDVMSRDEVLGQLGEIEQVAALVRRCREEGLPIEDAVKTGPYPEEFMRPALQRGVETGL